MDGRGPSIPKVSRTPHPRPEGEGNSSPGPPKTAPAPRAQRAPAALVYRMAAVTRNTADFAPTGVATLNPWEAWKPASPALTQYPRVCSQNTPALAARQ
jgi:hypothetical protein